MVLISYCGDHRTACMISWIFQPDCLLVCFKAGMARYMLREVIFSVSSVRVQRETQQCHRRQVIKNFFATMQNVRFSINSSYSKSLKNPNQSSHFKSWQEITLKDNVQSIKAGRESSYFLFENGSVGACGRNDEGQLGDGTFIDQEYTEVDIPKGEKIYKLGSGPSAQSVFFIGEDDQVYAAGVNDRYQLGINEIGSQKFPVKMDFGEVSKMDIDKVSASGTHTIAIACLIFTVNMSFYINCLDAPTYI